MSPVDAVWPSEDGGPSRLARVPGGRGPRAGSGAVVAVRHEPLIVMAVHAPVGRLLVLRASFGTDAASWVEDLDPATLAVVGRSEDLALGPFWPGGLAATADGGCVVVQGRHAHRLDADLRVSRQVTLPVDAPYNSFVALADGTLATKDLQRPGGPPSTLSLLDPDTLEDRAAPTSLPEGSVARLSADGDLLVVVGVDALHRYTWDSASGDLQPCADPARYRCHDDQSFGWDPVVGERHIWWMDNGDHTFPQGMTMLGNGVAAGPVRLWRLDRDGTALDSTVVSGRPHGAITNPPLLDERRGLVVAYDSANAVLAAFAVDTLEPRWRIDLATAQHLVLYPGTGEILANHFEPGVGDSLAVVDIDTGEVTCRVPVGSPAQSVVFPAPGFGRDAYYVSLSTIAHVTFA